MIATQENSIPTPQTAHIVLRDEERQRCEVWTRVMGYHRPMASFNTGKKGEFHERTYFSEKRCSSK
jgi:hypothetical protein